MMIIDNANENTCYARKRRCLLTSDDVPGSATIGSDQVAWLLAMADRYLPQSSFPSVSKQRDMQRYAMLYEIMDLCDLRFRDELAMNNGTPLYVLDDSPTQVKKSDESDL